MKRAPTKRRRRWIIVLLIALGLVAVMPLLVDPIVEWQVRKAEDLFVGYEVVHEDARVQLTKLNFALTKLKIMKHSAGGAREPFIYVEQFEASLYWRELLHGNLVLHVEVFKPKVTMIAAPNKAQQQVEVEVPNIAEKLEKLMPIKMDRLEVRQAELRFVDKTEPEFPELWLHDADLTVENLATRAALSRGEPTTIALSGRVQKSGEVSAYITADPLQNTLFFAGKARIRDVELSEFHQVISSKSGLHVEEGTLDVYVDFDCRGGKLRGGVKPLIKNAKVVQGEPGVGNALKAALADAAVKLLSDRVEGRQAIATTIPITGDITAPEVDLYSAILGVVRNAFVLGVSEGYEWLPPPEAKGKEDPLSKAAKALNPNEPPPKADAQGGGAK